MSVQEVEYVEHDAVVTDVDLRKGVVSVAITDSAECGECPAARLCAGMHGDASAIPVRVGHDARRYRKGEEVVVRGSERLHRKAIMLATVIPSIALVAVMILVYCLAGSQLAACLSGLGSMFFFFAALWLCRDRIAHEFAFDIEKAGKRPDPQFD